MDEDIVAYDIYMDKVDGKSARIAENHTLNKLESFSLDGNNLYYWRVITKDAAGNSSASAVFDFRTQ